MERQRKNGKKMKRYGELQDERTKDIQAEMMMEKQEQRTLNS
jgi:hypothetical protein